jgi:hypothetical protein
VISMFIFQELYECRTGQHYADRRDGDDSPSLEGNPQSIAGSEGEATCDLYCASAYHYTGNLLLVLVRVCRAHTR